jgi:hypothetical protein
VRLRTGIRRRPVVVLGRLSRRVCPALPVLRGPRRVPGTSPMSPPASWHLPRGGRRPGDRPRRLRRVFPGCPVRSRGARLRRPLLVRRGAGMCPPSSCRHRVSRGLRDREHRGLRAHPPLLAVRRLRLHLGLRACRIRPAVRGSRVHRGLALRVCRRLLVARVHRSFRVYRVGLVLRSRLVLRGDRRLPVRLVGRVLLVVRRLRVGRLRRVGLVLRSRPVPPAVRRPRVLPVGRVRPVGLVLRSRPVPPVPPVLRKVRVLRVLPARRSLLVPPVFRGPRLGPCITRKPCCPRPRRAALAFLRRRKPPALLAPPEPRDLPVLQGLLGSPAPLERLRALRSRCRPARCRPRLRVPYRPRARCLRPGSPRPGSRCRDSRRRDSLCPGNRCWDNPHRDSLPQHRLCPGRRCQASPLRDSPPRVSPRPASPAPVSLRPTATPSRRSPPSGPGIRPSFVTVRRTGRSSS